MNCSQTDDISTFVLAILISIVFARAWIFAWRDPEGFKRQANSPSAQGRATTLFLFRFFVPVIVVGIVVGTCQKLAHLIGCGAGNGIRHFFQASIAPLPIASPTGTLAIAAVLGLAFSWWPLRRLPIYHRIAAAILFSAFNFAGLQAASFHIGETADRWALIAAVIALLGAAYRWVAVRYLYGAPSATAR
ncbi:MAG TPA: hypothetical protein VN936_08335 [Candidatus Acidoferrum sp.]|nr:hypothetical protein [Candidatus Acidoferrum sp.]